MTDCALVDLYMKSMDGDLVAVEEAVLGELKRRPNDRGHTFAAASREVRAAAGTEAAPSRRLIRYRQAHPRPRAPHGDTSMLMFTTPEPPPRQIIEPEVDLVLALLHGGETEEALTWFDASLVPPDLIFTIAQAWVLRPNPPRALLIAKLGRACVEGLLPPRKEWQTIPGLDSVASCDKIQSLLLPRSITREEGYAAAYVSVATRSHLGQERLVSAPPEVARAMLYAFGAARRVSEWRAWRGKLGQIPCPALDRLADLVCFGPRTSLCPDSREFGDVGPLNKCIDELSTTEPADLQSLGGY
jgi:hypothetical protein